MGSSSRRVVFDRPLADLQRELVPGIAVRSLDAYLRDGEVVLAAVLERAAADDVMVLGDLAPDRVAPLAVEQARRGWRAELVAACDTDPGPRVAVTFARRRGHAASRVFGPCRFGDASGLFVESALTPEERETCFVQSITAFGAASASFADEVMVMGVVTPRAQVGDGGRFAWSVHLDRDPADRPWHQVASVRALAGVARPVALRRVGAQPGRSWVLSLWDDRLLEDWPVPDPLARGLRFAIDERVHAAELQARLEERGREGREPIAVARAHDGRFDVLYGAPGRTEPAPRTAWIDGQPLPDVESGAHPLDRWMQETMRRGGARHGQLAVVRGPDLVWARAHTRAEPGYPRASLDQPMRLGSVSKALTAIALLKALRANPLPLGLDTPIGASALLDLGAGAEGAFGRITLRHLLQHDAGLRHFGDLRHDRLDNPFSEARIARALGRTGPARAGDLQAALRRTRPDEALTRAPGGTSPRRFVYSNEGFILLGELLSKLVCGTFGDFDAALRETLLSEEEGARGPLLGSGRDEALARGESPAHPLSPTWEEARFGEAEGQGIALASYTYNGTFLGGAAGLSMSAVRLARVLARLGPRPGEQTALDRAELECLASPAADDSDAPAHGFYLGERGWWTTRRAAGPSATYRVVRLVHNGRIDGGTSLLLHQMPQDAADDGRDTTLGVVATFNSLFSLYDNPHGRELFAILRELEQGGRWMRPVAR